MDASHLYQHAAIASELARELAAYRSALQQLLTGWDTDLYRELCERFDRMEMLANALPRLSAGFTELLITRVELLHGLWELRPPAPLTARVAVLHERHEEVIAELLRKCAQYTHAVAYTESVPRF